MHVIIIGGGRVGLPLAETLAAHKHDVVIIENDKKVCEDIAEEFNGIVINGDGNEIDVLKEAKIEKADVFVAVTSNEELNLFSCLIAKDFSKIKTVARVTNPAYEKLFRKVGVDIVVSPEIAMESRLEAMIIEPNIADIAMIHRGDIEMLEFTIDENSRALGKTVRDLERPKGAIIVAIKENKEFLIPEVNTPLKQGDNVIVIVKKKLESEIKKMFI